LRYRGKTTKPDIPKVKQAFWRKHISWPYNWYSTRTSYWHHFQLTRYITESGDKWLNALQLSLRS